MPEAGADWQGRGGKIAGGQPRGLHARSHPRHSNDGLEITSLLGVPQVEILGLTKGMETLLLAARSNPDALAALHAAQKHPRAMQALQDVVANGIGAVRRPPLTPLFPESP